MIREIVASVRLQIKPPLQAAALPQDEILPPPGSTRARIGREWAQLGDIRNQRETPSCVSRRPPNVSATPTQKIGDTRSS